MKGCRSVHCFLILNCRILSGNVVALADLGEAEHKPVLFLFVSPTCNPCKALLPEFEQWQDDLSDKLRLVFLSNGTAEENLEKFEGDATKMILLQNEREVAEAVHAQWTPTAILMDANGRIASHVAAGDGAIRELVGKFKGSSSQRSHISRMVTDTRTAASWAK